MITLYTFPTPNGHKASIMLEEVGLPYKVVSVNLANGEQHKPEFQAVSPLNTVPAMIDENTPKGPQRIFGSGAILLYLAEKTGRLLPQDPNARAETLNWMLIALSDLAPAAVSLFRFKVRAPEPIPYAIDMFQEQVTRCYRLFAERLTHTPYLAGDEYSIADIAAFPFVRTAALARPELFDTMPSLKPWHDGIAARPAVQRGLLAGVEQPVVA